MCISISFFDNKITKGGEKVKKARVKNKKPQKERKRTMKKKLLIFVIAALFVALQAMPVLAADITIDADQYQSYMFVQPDLSIDSTTMTGLSTQTIFGPGLGEVGVPVLGEAELIESDPYSEAATLSIGDVINTGTTQLHIYGIGSTDDTTLNLTFDMSNNQSLSVANSMDENTMTSLMNVGADMSLSITGADGTISAAGLNEQVHSYILNRDDGAYQQGAVRTSITSGTFPQ
ncbi:hypothetical protein KJ695_05100 [Patescibacteria group bacterium]|nr:hypothetical protein [Patescibacteria group bacterium]MBU4124653.1 hypothetical protein [Nanoarchaeota archaeon]